MKKIQIMGIVFFTLLLAGYLIIGAPSELALPFKPLEVRVRLLGYISYIALAIIPPLLLGAVCIMVHQICNPQRDVTSYGRAWSKIVYLVLVIGICALFARGYLGYQTANAGYVQCINESRTSSKNSWRVYAKDLSLCKPPSDIIGD